LRLVETRTARNEFEPEMSVPLRLGSKSWLAALDEWFRQYSQTLPRAPADSALEGETKMEVNSVAGVDAGFIRTKADRNNQDVARLQTIGSTGSKEVFTARAFNERKPGLSS